MHQIFFLDNPGSISKTFIQNTIINRLCQKDDIVFAVVSLGIAATLLNRGFIAHS